jgi:hypothetical protein
MALDSRLREALWDLSEFRTVYLESPSDALHLLDMIEGHGELKSSTTHWTLTYHPPAGQNAALRNSRLETGEAKAH